VQDCHLGNYQLPGGELSHGESVRNMMVDSVMLHGPRVLEGRNRYVETIGSGRYLFLVDAFF